MDDDEKDGVEFGWLLYIIYIYFLIIFLLILIGGLKCVLSIIISLM